MVGERNEAMKKRFLQGVTFFVLTFTMCLTARLSAEAHTTGQLVEENGEQYLYSNGEKVINDFVFDGKYTYYARADGTPMKDRLTYHPDGEHIIYFDQDGHEVFGAFQYCESVGYTCYFDSQGYIYKDQITFCDYYNKDGEWIEGVFYLNANGKMEDSGWFQFANGRDYGYAGSDGRLHADGFGYDPWGRVVYYHWNGMVARGLITDYNNYYSFSEDDGHYLGQFSAGNPNPQYGYGKYIVGINIPAGEYVLKEPGYGVEYQIFDAAGNCIRKAGSTQNLIFTVSQGQTVYIYGTATADLASCEIDLSQRWLNAKIGVHLQPGVYRIQGGGSYYSGTVYYNLWNDSTFLNGVASSHQFSVTGEYVDVRVSEGQMLELCNAYIVGYVGP